MGKRNRKSKGAPTKNSEGNSDLPKSAENANQELMTRQTKRETMELVNQLLDSSYKQHF